MEELAVSQVTSPFCDRHNVGYLLFYLFKIFNCCVLCKNLVMTALYFVVLNNFSGYFALWRSSAITNLFLPGVRESCIFNWNKVTITACIKFFLLGFFCSVGWLFFGFLYIYILEDTVFLYGAYSGVLQYCPM